MSNLEFAVGKRVQCIQDGLQGRDGEISPIEGCVYTIREIEDRPEWSCFGVVGLRLEEIRNVPRLYWGGIFECAFLTNHFRPVRETSIDCFTALLEKPPVRLREDA